MAAFDSICEWLLNIEDAGLSGKVEDLGDGAGLTRFGITQKWDAADISSTFFTETVSEALAEAKAIYRKREWAYIRGDEIEPDDVAASLFSFAVNLDQKKAVEIAQAALNLDPDGVVGPVTLIGLDSPGTGDKVREAIAAHYRAHDQGRFLNGLLKRAYLVYPSLEGFV